MANERSIILHHYPASPFAEKVRLALSLKNLSWSGVETPMVAPKPDLGALTGGYRRTPVMQIGADVYCDTRLILDELERRYTLHPLRLPGHEGMASIASHWADRVWFPISSRIVWAAIGDQVSETYRKDRAQMTGQPFDMAVLKEEAPLRREQWISHLCALESRLSGGRHVGMGEYLVGHKPGLVDIHAYYNVWFVARHLPDFVGEAFEICPNVRDWFERLKAERGQEEVSIPAERAIEIARNCAPRLVSATVGYEPRGLKPGIPVAVAPDDYGRDWVEGRLVHADTHRVIVKRFDERAETVHVHFPRAGYEVQLR